MIQGQAQGPVAQRPTSRQVINQQSGRSCEVLVLKDAGADRNFVSAALIVRLELGFRNIQGVQAICNGALEFNWMVRLSVQCRQDYSYEGLFQIMDEDIDGVDLVWGQPWDSSIEGDVIHRPGSFSFQHQGCSITLVGHQGHWMA